MNSVPWDLSQRTQLVPSTASTSKPFAGSNIQWAVLGSSGFLFWVTFSCAEYYTKTVRHTFWTGDASSNSRVRAALGVRLVARLSLSADVLDVENVSREEFLSEAIVCYKI